MSAAEVSTDPPMFQKTEMGQVGMSQALDLSGKRWKIPRVPVKTASVSRKLILNGKTPQRRFLLWHPLLLWMAKNIAPGSRLVLRLAVIIPLVVVPSTHLCVRLFPTGGVLSPQEIALYGLLCNQGSLLLLPELNSALQL